MRALIFLSFFAPLNASAFLFGGISDKRAEDMLSGMNANFDRGDCQAVTEISQELFNENPSSIIRERAYSYLGRCYETQGLSDKAVTIYQLANGLYPENYFFSARLAGIYLRSGFHGKAVPLFKKVLKNRSYDVEANAGLARSYAEMGFISKAKYYFSRAAILGDFGDLALLKEYSAQMLRKRDWEEAGLIAGYALKLAPRDAGLYEVLARISAGRGDYKKAAGIMRAAVSLAPADASFALELSLLELLAGDCEAALSALPATGTDHAALALVIRGMALHTRGEYSRALECFKEAAGSGRPFIAPFAAALVKTSNQRPGSGSRQLRKL